MKLLKDVKIKLQKSRNLTTTEKSLRFVVILANCFGLLPVSGVISEEESLHFKWKSSKVLYSLIMTMAASYTLIVGVIYLTQWSTLNLICK